MNRIDSAIKAAEGAVDAVTSRLQQGHTPGPWRLIKGVDAWEIRGPLFSDRSAIFIAELSLVNEVMENARLIAAAPEMLEALERAATFIGEQLIDGDTNEELLAIHDAMFQAIQKAKGGL